jgi:cytochrome c oxidase assembly protein subunit 15
MIAGSIVRTSGSGMGCPDWPKCFDQYIPPTSVDELPADYKEKYRAYRQKKIEKFSDFLSSIGFGEVAQALSSDESLLIEQDFNPTKTWVEYGNRLVGFIAGNLVLILFIWTLIRYRSNRLLFFLTFLNLILLGIEAWFGSIVVATNLVPWTITLHMFLALVIVGIQLKIILIARDRKYPFTVSPLFKYLFFISIILTFIQIILGAQVRQEVDFLVKDAVDRSSWISEMDTDFYFHRSFSWVLLLVNIVLLYLNRKMKYGIPTITFIVGLILFEFITGVLFSYANMPAFVQPAHLLIASILLGVQYYSLAYLSNFTK